MSLTLLSLLLAGPVEDHLDAGRQSLQSGDLEQASKELDAAEEALPDSEEVVLSRTLATIHFYRGVIAWREGDQDGQFQHWRRALVVDPAFKFDSTMVDNDVDAADLFEALRSEVRQRPQVPSGLEEGDPRTFIDGRLMHDYDHLYAGTHLVQVLCDDGLLHGALVEIPPTPIYGSYCPGYVAPVVETNQPVELVVTMDGEAPRLDRGVPVGGVAMMGGGGLLLAAGVVLNFAVVAPTFQQVQQARNYPQVHDRASADELTDRFNRARWATLGLWGAGAATLGAGAVWTVRF